MDFIDSHIHLQDYKQNCATDIIASALKAGAKRLVCASVLANDWDKVAAFYHKYPDIIVPAFGLHPWYLDKQEGEWEERLEQKLKDFPQALVGESGIDAFRHKEKEPQLTTFKKHIALAKKYNRPLIIHAVKASEWLNECWNIMPQKFVLHSFNARLDLLNKSLSRGGYISFSASILRNRDKESIIRTIPSDKLLIETDGPYQAVEQNKESNPATDIPWLIEKLAEIRQETSNYLSMQIYKNSLEFIRTW